MLRSCVVGLLFSFLCGILVGCGDDPTPTSTTTPAPSPTPTPAPTPTPSALKLRTVQTAFNKNEPDLLKETTGQTTNIFSKPHTGALSVDTSKTFQVILGFGGAFTEASALNWKAMTEEDRQRVIKLYFGDPSEGGNGYTIGRVPMGSCDFSKAPYTFANVSGDINLTHFDDNVTHDEENGMLPMMRAASKEVGKREQLKIYASPWSPPAWMKIANKDGTQSLTGSAEPLGLNKTYMRSWAKYFSRFITAYKRRGIDLWAVTPQNEPEYPARWEACVYTPEYEAEFVRDHLGPVLQKDHRDVKIMAFDHNKDHVVQWAKTLYEDQRTKDFIDGIAVHFYGGLNTQHLNTTHFMAPDKFILPSEACNCPGVTFQNDGLKWWTRAEKTGIDILEDIKWWSVGWTDWNLLLDTKGGPNHEGNFCDANIISDPTNKTGLGTVVIQASYYYMAHFSRFLPRGSRRVALENTVVPRTKMSKRLIIDKHVEFVPCAETIRAQWWTYNESDLTLRLTDLPELCAEKTNDNDIQMKQCRTHSSQQWNVTSKNNTWTLVNVNSSMCLTEKQTSGQTIGLDPGVDAQGGFVETCNASSGQGPRDTTVQKFIATNRSSASFSLATAAGNCMLPAGAGNAKFDAVAFVTPNKNVSMVVLNMDDEAVHFDIYDVASKVGFRSVELPAHAIATYTWPAAEHLESVYV
eukprot:TRINITY_DN68807_c0_g1_i1.p1 TRINITY_DN68807_c0_g1~~TRINITY_DN68807_c0_g1_i1.p1  ORF type:complete len:716 (+),score=88.68 TRINITY_DN68807_c0_g1_i1:73-2148(+)